MKKNKAEILERLLFSCADWIHGKGPFSDVVISSRIRLARNLENIPFPARANHLELQKISNLLNKGFQENIVFKRFNQLFLHQLSSIEMRFLMEKNIISSYYLNTDHAHRFCIFNPEETLSIMVNEEDHIRIQSFSSGLQLKKIWKKIDDVDNEIEKKVTYAFNEKQGYLTTCPTNVGTGMRASVMLYLPALVMQNKIGDILKALSKLGYAVRGFYGEGSKAMGNLFQVSNQITLGFSEDEIIESLIKLCSKMITQEKKARKYLFNSDMEEIEDRTWRSYGILKNARIISSVEAMELLSRLRFGVELGIMSEIKRSCLNQLMFLIQPAYLQLLFGKKLNENERDFQRAAIIREKI